MASRHLVSASVRETLFGVLSDTASLERNYVLADDDLDLICTRRSAENRLGLAIHIALLRHPGQGWLDGDDLPGPLIRWLAEQVAVPSSALAGYGTRNATRSSHRQLAIRHLGLRPFVPDDRGTAIDLAARAAFHTDEGRSILIGLINDMKVLRFVLPSTAALERIGLAGRARARRISAQALNDALDRTRKGALTDLLKNDPAIGQSRLSWLRGRPHSTSATSLHSLLARLRFLREIGLPPDLGQNIHPARLARFAREGEVAPIHLLNDFGERRRMASLAAQMLELDIVLTDAAVAMFERLTGQLFTRSKNKQDQSWSAGKARIGRLIQLFGGTIDAMMRAREQDQDPFAVLDAEIGWTRLLQSRDEIAAFGDLATEGALTLASKRYAQLRRFAPAFLEAFEFSVPEGGKDLLGAVTLLKEKNRTGKRKLPDIVPMPFPGKHWESLILEDGRPSRRVYETAVIATLRDRLRAGDVWVEGSRDYRRFDAYLPPVDEAENVLADSGLETDGPTWLDERRERLHHRLREMRQKLVGGHLEGVRLEGGRLKIMPYDPITPPAGETLDRAIDGVMPRIRITDLLWDVNAQTGFLDAFTDLRSGRTHSNPAAVLAAILAGATNLGLERMAQASRDVSHAQLSWASIWHLRSETYADSLARIIDTHHALPFAKVWGSADKTSSDGQFFPSGRNSGEINAKYGFDPGLKIYSFLSGQYGSFHSSVIGATAGEATFRPGRAYGQCGSVQSAGALRRYRRRFRSCLRTVPSPGPDLRATPAGFSGSPSRMFRQAWPVERARSHHGETDQSGCGARPLGRRAEVDGQYHNRVRKALGHAAQTGRLPTAEPPVSRARRDRPDRTHVLYAGLDRKPSTPDGVSGRPQQRRSSSRPGPGRIRAFAGPRSRPFQRRSAKTRHGAEPRARRDYLLEHILHGQSR